MSEPLTEFFCVVEGNPGDASVNGWKMPVIRGRGAKAYPSCVEGKKYRAWKRKAAAAYRAKAGGRVFAPGPLTVALVAYLPRKHRTGPAKGLPLGDWDAPIKAVFDAIAKPDGDLDKMNRAERARAEAEHAGLIASDALIVRGGVAKAYDKDRPRIEVKVRLA